MLARLRDAVVVNWPVKVTALGLAAVLWAVVAAEEPASQLIPVHLAVRPPDGRNLTSPVPDVRARYAGTNRELLRLYRTPPEIRKNIPDTVTGALYTLELSLADLPPTTSERVRAQDIEPPRVTVRLDDVARKVVPVVAQVSLRPDSGFALLGGIAVTPGQVTIAGPGIVVQRVRQVTTVPLELANLRGPFAQRVAIDTVGLSGVAISPRTVEVAADVGAVSERVLMGVSVDVRGDRAAQWDIDPPAVLVTVRGPAGRLPLLTRDSVEVFALPLGRGPAETVRLEVVLPPGITGVATPDTAVLRRRGRG